MCYAYRVKLLTDLVLNIILLFYCNCLISRLVLFLDRSSLLLPRSRMHVNPHLMMWLISRKCVCNKADEWREKSVCCSRILSKLWTRQTSGDLEERVQSSRYPEFYMFITREHVSHSCAWMLSNQRVYSIIFDHPLINNKVHVTDLMCGVR